MPSRFRFRIPEFQVESGSQWALDFVYEAGVPFDSLPVATFDHEETMLRLASALHVAAAISDGRPTVHGFPLLGSSLELLS